MSKVLIEESTLTALGDALRSKDFIPATRKITINVDYFTATYNATSETDPTYYNRNEEDTVTIPISIPEATSLKFEIEAHRMGNPGGSPDLAIYLDSYFPASGGIRLFTVSGVGGEYNQYYNEEYTLENRNSCTLYFTDENNSAIVSGAIVRVYPLDAEGNVIPGLYTKEIDITNTVSPSVMIDSINEASVLPEEAFKITGNCQYRFAYDGWNWFISTVGDKVLTENISAINSMFAQSKVTKIPFVINIDNSNSLSSAFNNCNKLEECPKIRGNIFWSTGVDLGGLITGCSHLRDIEDLFEPEMLDGFVTVKCTSSYSYAKPLTLNTLCSLRKIPTWYYKFKLNEESTAFPGQYGGMYYNNIYYCYALDEALNIPVWRCKAAATSNLFSSFVYSCHRLKNFTFEVQEDGTPYEAMWKSQTINLSSHLGYYNTLSNALNYNSGITKDKEVKDDATYQALKDDPDWFTTKKEYSRYNHDSAVATINSLPDTSAYLATAGGTNTIKFTGTSGSLTDGGAINTLTEEEIAVATAKGWTVTLA